MRRFSESTGQRDTEGNWINETNFVGLTVMKFMWVGKEKKKKKKEKKRKLKN